MTSAAEKLEQAIQSLKHANGLQQEAFALLGITTNDCYGIHMIIEDAKERIQEILDQVKEPV